MTCQDVIDRDIAEDYLLGRLAEPQREAFEQHYFECDRCFTELEAMRAVQSELRRLPLERRPAPPPRRRFAPQWVAAAAAILLLTAGGFIAGVVDLIGTLRHENAARGASRSTTSGDRPAAGQPAVPEEVQRLAQVTPPPASTTQLRSGPLRVAFADGMRRYRAADYPAAIALLERAVGEEPAAEDARFYLGASQLLAGNAGAAITILAPIAERSASAYAEESRFLSAKAYLRLGDIAQATEMLNSTIALRGDRERDAVALRDALSALRPR